LRLAGILIVTIPGTPWQCRGHTKDISHLSEKLRLFLRRRAPGLIVVLNLYSQKMYNVDYHVLLARSPASAYRVIEKAYRSRAPSAARELLARPLIEALGRSGLYEDEIIEHAARGDDIGVFVALGLLEKESIKDKNQNNKIFKEAVATALACSLRMEEIVARIYSQLAKKLKCPQADSLAPALDYIASGSRAHFNVLISIASALGINVDECRTDDENMLAELEAMYRQLNSRKTVSQEEALAILGKLAAVEENMSEEKYVKLLIPLLTNILEGKMLKLYHSLLESIIRDEENHERIAKIVYDMLVEYLKR